MRTYAESAFINSATSGEGQLRDALTAPATKVRIPFAHRPFSPFPAQLFEHIFACDGGFGFLVDLRGHLLDHVAPPPSASDSDSPFQSMARAIQRLVSQSITPPKRTGGGGSAAARLVGGLLRGDAPDAPTKDDPQTEDHEAVEMQRLDVHLRSFLFSMCSMALLRVERLAYDTTSMAIAARLAKYDAVHPMASVTDVQGRLMGADRRCYALSHCAMPDDPLCVVYVRKSVGIVG